MAIHLARVSRDKHSFETRLPLQLRKMSAEQVSFCLTVSVNIFEVFSFFFFSAEFDLQGMCVSG